MATTNAVETRQRLIDATLSSLVDRGFSATTGVEVCRRADLTRGALNHHYPEFSDLLADALEAAYVGLLGGGRESPPPRSLEHWVHAAHRRLSQPEFKAVIELWLASQNSPDLGAAMARQVESLAWLFAPDEVLGDQPTPIDAELRRTLYRTVAEALIGLALGRASRGGRPLRHEAEVVGFLAAIAAAADQGRLEAVLHAEAPG
ncbi:MAG: TetR/AcrR family transcriptional regulator [Actinomycetota bacterium]